MLLAWLASHGFVTYKFPPVKDTGKSYYYGVVIKSGNEAEVARSGLPPFIIIFRERQKCSRAENGWTSRRRDMRGVWRSTVVVVLIAATTVIAQQETNCGGKVVNILESVEHCGSCFFKCRFGKIRVAP
jgi:hypothetical protein